VTAASCESRQWMSYFLSAMDCTLLLNSASSDAISWHWKQSEVTDVLTHTMYTTHSKIRYPVGKGDHKVYEHGKPGKVI